MYTKYESCTSVSIRAIINLRNLKVDFETKTDSEVKVRGLKNIWCIWKGLAPKHVCISVGIGNINNSRNFNADLKT